MVASRRNSGADSPKRPPARTPEARENQMIDLAVGLAEKQMMDGTASSQVMTHYLKLGTTRERLEQERLRNENLLLQAKMKNMASSERIEQMYDEALKSMRAYKGEEVSNDEID